MIRNTGTPVAPLAPDPAEAPVNLQVPPSSVDPLRCGSPEVEPATVAQATAAMEGAAADDSAPDNNVSPSEAATLDKHQTMQEAKSQEEARPPATDGTVEARADASAAAEKNVLRITSDMYTVAHPGDPAAPTGAEGTLHGSPADAAGANNDRRNGDETDARMGR